MQIPIVNEQDEVIAYKERRQVDIKNDITRSSGLMIFNSKGEVLLSQRTFNTPVDPGKWGEAVGGTVDGEDSYYETVVRETREELGIEISHAKECAKQFITSDAYKCFVQWYSLVLDEDLDYFTIQPNEVEQIKWVNREALLEDLAANPSNYVAMFSKTLELFLP